MGNKQITRDEFIELSKNKHGDALIYDKVEYINKRTKVILICKKHGEFLQSPGSNLYAKYPCPKCNPNKRISNQDEYIKAVKIVHIDKYDLSHIIYTKATNKIEVGCYIHGLFSIQANNFLNNHGCIKCVHDSFKNNYSKTLEQFITESNELFDDKYDYSKSKYVNAFTPLTIGCEKHGEFIKIPNSHLNGQGCPKCKFTYSTQELKILNWYDFNFIQNDRSVLEGKEIDLLYKNIGIEVNGVYWHSDKFADKYYHLNKTKLAEIKGIQLLHFWDTEVNKKPNLVKSMIDSKLGLTENKIYARKCIIKEVDNNIAKQFLDSNHLQEGKYIGKIRLGLYYNSNLVSIMTFAKPRFNKNYDYELIRFCNIINTNVIGGASKLLSYFRKNYKGSIISYANRRFSNGKLYETLGFNLLNETEPNYFYIDGYNNMYSRNMFQKHKLKDILKDFDNNLSEHENMLNNGYHRVYDCGNLVYVMED